MLLGIRQILLLAALHRATLFVSGCTFSTLDEEQVTTVVGTVGMGVAGFAALVATGDDLSVDGLTHSSIEDEVFTDKIGLETELPDVPGILQDPAVQLVHIPESVVLQIGAGLFAADASRAIKQQFGILLLLQQVGHYRELFAEGIRLGTDGSLESSNLRFIVVAHVDHDVLAGANEVVELFGIEVAPHIRDVEGVILKSVGHQLRFHLDGELVERFPVVFDGIFDGDVFEDLVFRQRSKEGKQVLFRYAHLGVDAFAGQIDPAEAVQFGPFAVELVPEFLRVIQDEIAVKGDGFPDDGLGHQVFDQYFSVDGVV